MISVLCTMWQGLLKFTFMIFLRKFFQNVLIFQKFSQEKQDYLIFMSQNRQINWEIQKVDTCLIWYYDKPIKIMF